MQRFFRWIRYLTSTIRDVASTIRYVTSTIRYVASTIQYVVSMIRYVASTIRYVIIWGIESCEVFFAGFDTSNIYVSVT